MKTVSPAPDIALVDDGELEEVARLLEASGIPFVRHRGGQIPKTVVEPRSLLIVTARRLEHVVPARSRRGGSGSGPQASPRKIQQQERTQQQDAGAAAAAPLRIVAVGEDSPALRRRLRRQGMQILVRLPAQRETWRLLIARALYRGEERRGDERVAPEVPVQADRGEAVLVDLSNRGCRIQTSQPLAVGESLRLSIPAAVLPDAAAGPLPLSGRIRRVAQREGSDRRTYAVVFEADLPLAIRRRLTSAINHWASGDASAAHPEKAEGPRIPSCRLPSLPDLVLDDETDPPIRAREQVAIDVAAGSGDATPGAHRERAPADTSTDAATDAASERRSGRRGHYQSVVRASQGGRAVALVGRDLSARGMRIERHPELALGDRFRIALHGPTLARPIQLDAAIVRDDAERGLALAFIGVAPEMARTLEKLVACLPDVESLEEGEVAGLGTVLSEILSD